MKKITLLGVLAGAVSLPATPALSAELVYDLDFDSPYYVAPGVMDSISGFAAESAAAGAWNAAGWSGIYAVNRSTGNPAGLTVLTLGGLVANSTVTLDSGVLGFLESWDSYDGGCCSPDYLDVFINGSLVATMTANNALGSVEDYDGATELFDGVQVNANGYYSDTLVDLSTASFANSLADGSGNWSFGIQARGGGWQGGSDEAWGFDNLAISGTVARVGGAVPEPATWAMMIAGFGLVAGTMRRRRRPARIRFA